MITLTQAQYDELRGYAALLANAEALTMADTLEAHTYSLADINTAGSDMLDILDAASDT